MHRNKNQRPGGLALFAALLVFYALVFGGRWLWLRSARGVRLEAARSEYLHYEFVDVRLRTRDPVLNRGWRSSPPVVTVTRDGRPVPTIADMRQVRLHPDGWGAWSGRWPCPWNAPAGEYRLELTSAAALGARLRTRPFRIAHRRPQPLPRNFAVLTLESDLPLEAVRIKAPDGSMKDWRGMLDWVEYAGADAFWVLGGRSPGSKPGQVWLDYNLPFFPKLARECRRRGIKFGIYVQCYLTMSSAQRVPGYEYAVDVEDGVPRITRAVSLREDKRVRDIVELLKRFRDIPEVDYVGLDYIRNALGGMELVDDFYADMAGVLAPPPEFATLNREERMIYFARKKAMRKDMRFIDAWQWWRAHRVSGVIKRIKSELGEAKPLWAFVLTWDKGWHHGQDPVMFNDAGVDAAALMLYEADADQYTALLHDWSRYVRRGDAQLLVGDVVDWPLHQKNPDGPKEFYRRTMRAQQGIYADGPAYGIFVHDLGRALWGRLGPWSTRAWMDEARAAIRSMKRSDPPAGEPVPSLPRGQAPRSGVPAVTR